MEIQSTSESKSDALTVTHTPAPWRQDAIDEVGRLKAIIAALTEACVVQDSYGVIGSDFSTCICCGAGGAPGIEFKHTERCEVGRAEDFAESWFQDQRNEIAEYEAEDKMLRDRQAALIALLEDCGNALTDLTEECGLFDKDDCHCNSCNAIRQAQSLSSRIDAALKGVRG